MSDNLPSEIILDILSRLPIRTIVSCKCVCRQFLELITSAAFADLHLPRSTTPALIIQRSSDSWCKMFEFEDEAGVQNHDLHHKQFEFEDEAGVQNHDLHHKRLMKFQPRDIITTPGGDIQVRGSVNGLLCLVENVCLNNFYICNPITREYIALPDPEEILNRLMVATCGFGVSSSSGEYKLVRISHGPPSDSPVPDLKCVIYTLGTGSWRSIPVGITFKLKRVSPHVFLSGSLHWLVGDADGYSFIACFNLETELFNSLPQIPFSLRFRGYRSLGILGDCLCVCDLEGDEEMVIWAMKDYGVGESWTKEFVIRREIGAFFWIVFEGFTPLKYGDILFVCDNYGIFYYSTKTETASHVYWSKRTDADVIAAMFHTPSLLSLKRFDKENVAPFLF